MILAFRNPQFPLFSPFSTSRGKKKKLGSELCWGGVVWDGFCFLNYHLASQPKTEAGLLMVQGLAATLIPIPRAPCSVLLSSQAQDHSPDPLMALPLLHALHHKPCS